MTVINLVPHEVLVAPLLVLLAGYAGLDRLVSGRSSEYRQLTGECSEIREDLRSAEALIQERDRLLARRATIVAIQHSAKTSAVLAALGDALTPESYLTFLAVERCAPKPAGDEEAADCRGRLHLRGRAPGHREVGRVIRQLESTSAFGEVTLGTITDPVGTAGGGVEFELFCSLGKPGR